MLRISDQQLELFEQAAARNFEDQMVEHLREFTPKHSEILGEDGVRRIIRLGQERAKNYGFVNRGPVRFYIELIFMLGSDFDTDPQLPWAAEVLNDSMIPNQTVRADQLHDKVMNYVGAVAGPEYKYAKEALRRASRERIEDISSPSGSEFYSQMLMRLNKIFPEKYQYVGELNLRRLIQRGIKSAESQGFTSERDFTIYVGLMFALGHGFAHDPQFPWIETTLNNTVLKEQNRRIERLYSKMMTYLERVLVYLEK